MQDGRDTQVRLPEISVLVDHWDLAESPEIKRTSDITDCIKSYNFSKSIKSPGGSASIALTPLLYGDNPINIFKTMDVVKIYEFGVLKFQGYISRVGINGSASPDGTVNRNAILEVKHFGNLFVDADLGINMAFSDPQSTFNYKRKAEELNESIAKAIVSDGKLTFKEIFESIYTIWLDLLTELGGVNFKAYINTYVDMLSGVSESATQGTPSQLYIFTALEDNFSFWDLIEKSIELPFNEAFFDEGPRDVGISGKVVNLPNEKTYFIFRETPFNGTVKDGVIGNAFDTHAPYITISSSALQRYDLNKHMEESYSFYLASPPIFNLGNLSLIASGQVAIDQIAFNKYLYRPLIVPLYYTRVGDSVNPAEFNKYITDCANTLFNWHSSNDECLSGIITVKVLSVSGLNARIGDRVALDILDCDFYAEGVAHQWEYQGPLLSSISVTRGLTEAGKQAPVKGVVFGNIATIEKVLEGAAYQVLPEADAVSSPKPK